METVWILTQLRQIGDVEETKGVFSSSEGAKQYVADHFGYLGDWTHISETLFESKTIHNYWFQLERWDVLI